MNKIELALQIATKAHEGQVDKSNTPYINHPIHVASLVDTENEKIVALLHDVVEDTDVTIEDLRATGFSEIILDAVYAITRQADESLNAYMRRIKSNPLATKVKIADITHNMDLSRLDTITDKDLERNKRYQKQIKSLIDSSEILK